MSQISANPLSFADLPSILHLNASGKWRYIHIAASLRSAATKGVEGLGRERV
jgi:hypothetical protein